MANYPYVKPGPTPDLEQLRQDVQDSDMTQAGKDAYTGATWNAKEDGGDDDILHAYTTEDLSSADQTILESLVGALGLAPIVKARKAVIQFEFSANGKCTNSYIKHGATYSNVTGAIAEMARTIYAVSVVCSKNSSATLEIYANGVLKDSVILSSEMKKLVDADIDLLKGAEIAIKCMGEAWNPKVTLYSEA